MTYDKQRMLSIHNEHFPNSPQYSSSSLQNFISHLFVHLNLSVSSWTFHKVTLSTCTCSYFAITIRAIRIPRVILKFYASPLILHYKVSLVRFILCLAIISPL